MTTLCIELDTSEAMRHELRGDPRFTDSETPSPQTIARIRDTTETIVRAAAIEVDAQP